MKKVHVMGYIYLFYGLVYKLCEFAAERNVAIRNKA